MHTVEVKYLGGLRTEAHHPKSGDQLHTDAPVDNHGQGAHFSPTDLVATATATCMLTVMGIKAEAKGWNLEGARAQVKKIMASAPRRIARLEIRIALPLHDLTDKDRALLEATAKSCPVSQSLDPKLEQVIDFHWF